MLRLNISSLSSILLALSAGCAAGSADPAPGQSDLHERLAGPLELGFVPSEDGSFARVTAVTLRDGVETEVEIVVKGGGMTLAVDDGTLRLESLEVTAADVTVGAGVMPPNGATFTGIAVSLSSPMETALADATDTAGSAADALAADLRWSVELQHGVVDLAPIRLPELPFELSLALASDGDVEAHLTASQPGPFWNWAGIFELRDLELELMASSGHPVPGSVE
jgi:hypothetical protein